MVHLAWQSVQATEHCSEFQPITQVSCWCVGELGQFLKGDHDDNLYYLGYDYFHLEPCSDLGSSAVSEMDVVTWHQGILSNSNISVTTKQYALMSLTKLSTRFSSVTAEIQRIIETFGSHLDADLQQRGVEFGQLFRGQAGMRSQLLEPMPVLEREKTLGEGQANGPAVAVRENGGPTVAPADTQPSSGLMDLLGLDDGSSSSLLSPGPSAAAPSTALDDILGLSLSETSGSGPGLPSLLDMGSSPALATSTIPSTNTTITTNGGLDSLLNGLDSASYTAAPASQEVPSLIAYEKHGLKVTFTFPSPAATSTTILLLATNLTSSPIQDFIFQVRVGHDEYDEYC